MSNENAVGSTVKRYAPVLALVALVLVVQTISPANSNTAAGGGGGTGLQAGAGSTGGRTGAGGTAAGGGTLNQADLASGATAGGLGAASGADGATTGVGPGGAGGAQPGAVAGSNGSQQLDSLGRPLTGDRGHCAPGGVLQDNATFTPAPCIPALVGSNGGATYQGITATTINYVILYPTYGQAIDAALNQAQLQMTPDQAKQADSIFESFINTHWNLYGRKLKSVPVFWDASNADPASERALAKQIVAQYHPFAVVNYVPDIMPPALADQLTQAGVMSFGTGELSDQFFTSNAPYSWDLNAQGFRTADMTAEYYCKKMYGKNANLAGDPTMRLKKRKLGVLAADSPEWTQVAQRFIADVSGGMCGTAADKPPMYTVSTDLNTAKTEWAPLATRMKNDGVTTSVGWPGSSVCTGADQQNYFPEILISGTADQDDDEVGQAEGNLCSPKQQADSFGIGWLVPSGPNSGHEDYPVAHAVDPSYDPPYLAYGVWLMLETFGRLVEWAGPHLTPQNIERGARSSPQLGGYANPHPWPGWQPECCHPNAPEWNFAAGANDFTAYYDAREVYWSATTISPSDNAPGTWVCVNACRRYTLGQWTTAPPEQSS
jgi:hypothetical protein